MKAKKHYFQITVPIPICLKNPEPAYSTAIIQMAKVSVKMKSVRLVIFSEKKPDKNISSDAIPRPSDRDKTAPELVLKCQLGPAPASSNTDGMIRSRPIRARSRLE